MALKGTGSGILESRLREWKSGIQIRSGEHFSSIALPGPIRFRTSSSGGATLWAHENSLQGFSTLFRDCCCGSVPPLPCPKALLPPQAQASPPHSILASVGTQPPRVCWVGVLWAPCHTDATAVPASGRGGQSVNESLKMTLKGGHAWMPGALVDICSF